jgi:hypothetical protein
VDVAFSKLSKKGVKLQNETAELWGFKNPKQNCDPCPKSRRLRCSPSRTGSMAPALEFLGGVDIPRSRVSHSSVGTKGRPPRTSLP